MPHDRDVRTAKTPPAGVRAVVEHVAAPVEVIDPDDEITQRIADPDARRVARAGRSTDARIERLEDKHDNLARDVAGLGQSLGEIGGRVMGIFEMSAAERDARIDREKREDRDRLERAAAAAAAEIAREASAGRRTRVILALIGLVVPLASILYGVTR